jgi:hypothetical protein
MELDKARDKLRNAVGIAVLTGAGISAESGVPTFRGDEGLWRDYRAEDLATAQAFFKDPTLVWSWYLWRRELIAACRPNPAHYALAGLEAQKPGMRLITQNVDGLHRLAGSRNLLEIHGCIWQVRCTACGESYEERELNLPLPPPCRSLRGAYQAGGGLVWREPGPEPFAAFLAGRGGCRGDAGDRAPQPWFSPPPAWPWWQRKPGLMSSRSIWSPPPTAIGWTNHSWARPGRYLPRLVQGGGA